MEDQEWKAGDEILSYCGKCKLPLAHIIISMVDEEKVGKCECKTCNAKHNYRDPNKPKGKGSRSKKPTVSPEQLWNEAVSKAKGDSKPYSMNGVFEEGSLLEHTSFGKGVVEKCVGEKKMEVIFKEGVKVLVCAPASTA